MDLRTSQGLPMLVSISMHARRRQLNSTHLIYLNHVKRGTKKSKHRQRRCNSSAITRTKGYTMMFRG